MGTRLVRQGVAIGVRTRGIVGGPIGTAVGAVVGAVAGGLAGKGVAESIDPTEEDAYWRDNYKSRPYASDAVSYDEYRPAYQYGWESRASRPSTTWDQAESDLERGWDTTKYKTQLGWDKAKHAAHDAWERVDTRCGTAGGGCCSE